MRHSLAVLIVLLVSATASGGSIWARGHRKDRKLAADDTARAVGDLLTIVINEESKIENDTTRTMDKSSSGKASTKGTIDPANALGLDVGEEIFNLPRLNWDGSNESAFEGESGYDSDRKVSDRITVVVEDVLPNGNMVILGKRTREVAGDTQTVQVSGIVRPSDVNFANTVSSEKVADFHIVHKTSGQENRFVNPGWLGRILNWLNPF